jgi:hypothetical protein
MNDPASDVDPEIRRRNLQLGLMLGGFALAIMAYFVVTFTRDGLPKDPKMWKQMQDKQQQRSDQP